MLPGVFFYFIFCFPFLCLRQTIQHIFSYFSSYYTNIYKYVKSKVYSCYYDYVFLIYKFTEWKFMFWFYHKRGRSHCLMFSKQFCFNAEAKTKIIFIIKNIHYSSTYLQNEQTTSLRYLFVVFFLL